jgi:hypothetical protein
VYDKTGNLQGTPETLAQFWCGTPGNNGQYLTGCISNPPAALSDTQIAFHPTAQRWIATTLAYARLTGQGIAVYFASSNSASALDFAGNWNRWSLPVCPPADPISDQPILGYNSNWIAVDTLCINALGQEVDDSLSLIPYSDIVSPPSSISPTTPTPPFEPFIAMRPSRDASGSGFPDLILAASQVPTDLQAYTELAEVDASGTISQPAFSPFFGFSGSGLSYLMSPGPQQGCTSLSSGCMVNLGDGRIKQVILQSEPDGNHYVVTSFPAGYGLAGGEAIWATGQIESIFPIGSGSNLWNVVFVGDYSNDPTQGWVPAYPTIAADTDFDLLATFASFSPSSFPWSDWYSFKQTDSGWNENGAAIFATSNGQYTGSLPQNCPTPTSTASPTPTGAPSATPTPSSTPTPGLTLQRWGDYATTGYDPTGASPHGEPGAFWSFLEFTNGGPDQSTLWAQFSDALPYFVSYSNHEQECANEEPGNCTLNLPTPASLQNGDVVIAFVDLGGNHSNPATPPDSSWVELSIQNLNGAVSMTTGSCGSNDLMSEYAYAHVYGSSNETGTYKFTHKVPPFCSAPYSEIEGAAVAYRAAGATLGSYLLYGYSGTTQSAIVTVGPAPANAPSEGTLLNVFYGSGFENNDNNENNTTFSGLTGTPAATAETSLPGTGFPYFFADLGLPGVGSPLGQYSVTSSVSRFHKWGWQVFVPAKY